MWCTFSASHLSGRPAPLVTMTAGVVHLTVGGSQKQRCDVCKFASSTATRRQNFCHYDQAVASDSTLHANRWLSKSEEKTVLEITAASRPDVSHLEQLPKLDAIFGCHSASEAFRGCVREHQPVTVTWLLCSNVVSSYF